jgi:hypothetical protein
LSTKMQVRDNVQLAALNPRQYVHLKYTRPELYPEYLFPCPIIPANSWKHLLCALPSTQWQRTNVASSTLAYGPSYGDLGPAVRAHYRLPKAPPTVHALNVRYPRG